MNDIRIAGESVPLPYHQWTFRIPPVNSFAEISLSGWMRGESTSVVNCSLRINGNVVDTQTRFDNRPLNRLYFISGIKIRLYALVYSLVEVVVTVKDASSGEVVISHEPLPFMYNKRDGVVYTDEYASENGERRLLRYEAGRAVSMKK